MKIKNVSLYQTDKDPCWMARYRMKVHTERGMITRQRNISTLLPKTDANKAQAQKIANDRRDEDIKRFWAAANGPHTACLGGKQAQPIRLGERGSTPTLWRDPGSLRCVPDRGD